MRIEAAAQLRQSMAFEIEQPGDLVQSPVVGPSKPRLLGVLGA
jgi:hypothetical protein